MEIHFAPLQGYTDDCYRRAHHQLLGGIDCYYTPFVRLEHGAAREKDLRDVRPDFNEGVPVVPQVIARDGQELSALIEVLRPMGYTRLDINMGCPFTLQTRHGRGAGLLPNPEAVEDICRIVRQHEGELTFSVKMRLGLHEVDEWEHVLPILNDTPLVHICLHPRTADEGYKGAVHLDEFARFAHLCDHPLLYNGDLRTPADLARISQQFPGLKGVMIGRGLLARPSLAFEYKNKRHLPESEHATHLCSLPRLCQVHPLRSTAPPEDTHLLGLRRTHHRAQGVEKDSQGRLLAQLYELRLSTHVKVGPIHLLTIR